MDGNGEQSVEPNGAEITVTNCGRPARERPDPASPSPAEAWNGAPIQQGRIYVAPGGPMHLEIRGRQQLVCRLTPGEPRSGHRPSVDMLFASVAGLGAQAVGVILTGMGRDGAEGLLQMRNAGASTIGQDARSSLVYGMPRAAAEAGAVERQLDLDAIPAAILAACSAARAAS